MSTAAFAAAERIPVPTPKDWADLAKLPDWSGTWNPDETKQNQETERNPTPWNAKAAKRIEDEIAEHNAGHPHNLYTDCLPEGMPTWMLIYHNAIEVPVHADARDNAGQNPKAMNFAAFIPTAASILADPDETFFGDSIGHWEGDTLVVDTSSA